jgi:predicted restriction endonuclease
MPNNFGYRKLAFDNYPPICAYCGFGIKEVLEVAHIDGKRSNNRIDNLVILCPNCHKMHDIDIISTDTIIEMRDRPKKIKWTKRMKDAGKKAALTRKHRLAGKRAAETRKRTSHLNK